MDLALRCRCGHVRGVAKDVTPSSGFRFVCYCRDCQAFARLLDRPDVLDAAGGTDIFQLPSSRVILTAGIDAVRCLRFSRHVHRWYAACCRTPIANTAGPRFPLVALTLAFLDERERHRALGPPFCRIFEGSATGPLPADAPMRASLAIRVRRMVSLFDWWRRGLGRPSPFFDAETGAPISAPRVVTLAERADLWNGRS